MEGGLLNRLGHRAGWIHLTKNRRSEGDPARFHTNSHENSCGIDLHAKTMYLCILDREGEVFLHRNIKSRPPCANGHFRQRN
ncbi:MAG: hypothetical protein GY937_03765 [bacterium]|nr:hypothetical protein [bacterium]